MKKTLMALMGVLYLASAGFVMADGTTPASTTGVKAAAKTKVKGGKVAKGKKAPKAKAAGSKVSNKMEGGEMQGGEMKK